MRRTRLRLQAMGENTVAALTAPSEVFRDGERIMVRWVHYTLVVVVARDQAETVLHWRLDSGGDDATAQADSLDFLTALHQRGSLEVQRVEPGDALLRVPLLGDQELDDELLASRELLDDIATLEEWSGCKLPVPERVAPGEHTRLRELVLMIRSRVVPLRLSPELTVTTKGDSDFDEVRVPVELHVDWLGHTLPFGACLLELPVSRMESQWRDTELVEHRVRIASGDELVIETLIDPPASRQRNLRRTLVAGAPPPYGSELVFDRLEAMRRLALEEFLADRDSERGRPISDDARAQVAHLWD